MSNTFIVGLRLGDLLTDTGLKDTHNVPNYTCSVSRYYWLNNLFISYRIWYYRGGVSNFDQSEARKQCFLASDWLKFASLP